MVRLVFLVAAAAACGSKPGGGGDHGGTGGDDASVATDASALDDATAAVDAKPPDAAPDARVIDAFPAVLDVRINCRNDCVLIADPAAINVSAGTAFEVNWINTGDTECDVAKIDQFNQVPIIIGLEPGMSYHDSVRDWCGAIFTGTFQFRVSICTLPSYIPVNCGA